MSIRSAGWIDVEFFWEFFFFFLHHSKLSLGKQCAAELNSVYESLLRYSQGIHFYRIYYLVLARPLLEKGGKFRHVELEPVVNLLEKNIPLIVS